MTFPYKLDDLVSWTIKRTDGNIVKFTLSKEALSDTSTTTAATVTQPRTTSSLGSYCSHTPTDIPVALFDPKDRDAGFLRLWVAGISGARITKDTFDFVIDGGDVLDLPKDDVLSGDQELVDSLSKYTKRGGVTPARILKIDWNDREAPTVTPEFWVRLNEKLHGDVMTCCVGGHGRSGTAFVCLLLANADDYSAKDAIIHLRAVHCPRAIESIAQWDYIDTVAKYMGRVANAKDAMSITDYHKAFLASKKPTAIATRLMLEEENKKVVTTP